MQYKEGYFGISGAFSVALQQNCHVRNCTDQKREIRERQTEEARADFTQANQDTAGGASSVASVKAESVGVPSLRRAGIPHASIFAVGAAGRESAIGTSRRGDLDVDRRRRLHGGAVREA